LIDKAVFQLPYFKKLLMKLAGISLLQVFSIIGQAVGLSWSIVIFWQGKDIQDAIWAIGLFLLSFVIRHVCTFVREKMLDIYAYEQARMMRASLLKKIFHLGPALVQGEGTGNVVTMTLEGISQMENYIRLISSKMLNMIIFPLVILLFVFTKDIVSGFVLFLVFPMIIVFMIVLGFAAQKKATDQFADFQVLSNHFLDSLRGLETLKLFGISKSYANAIYQTSERFRKSTMATLRIAMLSTFSLDFFTTLSVAIVAVFLGLHLMDGEIAFLPALTTLVLAPDFFLPIRDFASDYHASLDGKNALSAINRINNLPQVENTDELSDFSWSQTSELSISGMNFSYPNSDTGIKDFELDWKGYGKIGIIGKSGAGKSTIIQLISGFLQANAGTITLDDKKIPHFVQKNWQKNISFIPQKTYLFHGSLRENICLYVPNASEEQIAQAVNAAGLSELVENFPQGLDTIIGSGARQVSGGQAQRIALARAFLSNERNILLLDEPTAHLDIETEAQVKEELLPLLENKLVFLSTHRLHWMPQMDYIFVMDKGAIVAKGTHEELLATSSTYQQLIKEMRGETHADN